MPIYRAPKNILNMDMFKPSIFLAGSIETKKDFDWREEIEKKLIEKWNVFNPVRNDWNSSWRQDISNPIFNEQINWELTSLSMADHIIMFFDKDAYAPISLFEFGLYAKSGKMHVVCEEGFYRKGNVDVVCEKYRIPKYNSLYELLIKLNNNL